MGKGEEGKTARGKQHACHGGEGGAGGVLVGRTHNNPHTTLPGTVQARQLPAHVCCKLSLEDPGAVQQLTV
jgi:hypothetical protein